MPEQLPQQFDQDPNLEISPEVLVLAEKLNLKSQWDSQVNILNETGVIGLLLGDNYEESLLNPDKINMGITGIDPADPTNPNKSKDYPIPTYTEILQGLSNNPEQLKILEQKAKQGLNKMLLVPIGQSIDKLIKRYEELLVTIHNDNINNPDKGLFSTKQDGKLEKLPFDTNQPVYKWDQITNSDREGRLTYYPQDYFDNDFKGFTKEELLTNVSKDPRYQSLLQSLSSPNGWQILFHEDNTNLPAQGEGKTINQGQPNQRKQPEANDTSINYLNNLQTQEQYQSEQGFTLESWLIYAITHLKETYQKPAGQAMVIDDYQGKGKICWLLGSYLSGEVLQGYWYRGDRQAYLFAYDPGCRYGDFGLRSAAMIKFEL